VHSYAVFDTNVLLAESESCPVAFKASIRVEIGHNEISVIVLIQISDAFFFCLSGWEAFNGSSFLKSKSVGPSSALSS
jgi:hypothetical protein